MIFKGDGNYIYGMNSIPICAVGNQVTILAFCLMSNHVHFIVRGEEGSCRQFITQYKKRLATLADLSSTDVCVKRIDDSGYLIIITNGALPYCISGHRKASAPAIESDH